MTGMNDFLGAILDKQRSAAAQGMKLDLIVLHRDFYDVLMRAIGTERPAAYAFEIRQCKRDSRRSDIYLHGVKVMWSGSRLPVRQAWFRYSNMNFKTVAA